MRIYKYPLPFSLEHDVPLELPEQGHILSVQEQNNAIQVWVMFEPGAPLRTRYFRIVATGQDFDERTLYYLDTVQIGGLVWHVFVRGEP